MSLNEPVLAPASPDGKPVISFASQRAFEQWLSKNHATHSGIWLRLFKKASDRATVTYAEALDVALCYGWIDGQVRRGDDVSFLTRFSSRGKRSVWSKINTNHVARLTREGRMKPSGLAAVEAAKADGRWDAAYASSRTFEMPPEFTRALSTRAAVAFAGLKKSERYAIYYSLVSAKLPATRARRLQNVIANLEK